MKTKTLWIAVFALLMAVSGASAEDGFGVGVILGEPTGISVKKWISQDRAIDGAAAWSLSDDESFQIHADYLIHKFDILKINKASGRLPVYFGVGARVKFEDEDDHWRGHDDDDDVLVGVRVPFGISYILAKEPVDFFAEIVPILDVAPDTDFDLNAAIGARFYFR
ncbi:MAG: DUF3996 domain-containing protein [Desulfosalsimonadaceae bacterium]|nr:DUF3996 domain-containing protein [Desulfosalsimonadaceae bacterium]